MNAIPPSLMSPADAFRHAVEVMGGQVKAAEFMGRTQSAISKRLARGAWMWAESVLAVETETGISRHVLRPDIYPRENPPPPRATRGDAAVGVGAPNARPAGNPVASASPVPSANPIPSGREGSAPAADCFPAAGVDHSGDRRS